MTYDSRSHDISVVWTWSRSVSWVHTSHDISWLYASVTWQFWQASAVAAWNLFSGSQFIQVHNLTTWKQVMSHVKHADTAIISSLRELCYRLQFRSEQQTRSQAVARIADRTACLRNIKVILIEVSGP